ncbi:MAG: tetratricopeptide repeat protein [Gammaproteobacteria bacterium]
MFRRILPAVLATALLAIAAPSRADFNDGAVAYSMGDYERALQTLRPLAETANHAYAQYYLGVMYMNGQGVPQDFKQAAKWLRSAAEKGVSSAQSKLAQLYIDGRGVPRDMEFAFAWLSTSVKLGNARAAAMLEQARAKMSAGELAQAEKLAAEYVARYGTVPKETSRAQ